MPSLESARPFEWVAADPHALSDAFEASGATRTPAPPDWSGYAQVLAERLANWFGDAAEPLANALGPNLQIFLRAIVPLLTVLLLVVIVIGIIRAFNARPQSLRLEPGPRLEAAVRLTPEQYRKAAVRSLETGDVRQALTSMWWWFAASALRGQPGRAMTTGEVIAISGRADLRLRAQTLDRLRFGAAVPAPAEVRLLLAGFEVAL